MDTMFWEGAVVNLGFLSFYFALCFLLYAVYCKLSLSTERKSYELEPFFPDEKTVVANHCQHRTALVGEVRGGGESRTVDLMEKFAGKVEFCHICLEKMVIRCAWCGMPIFPFKRVTLYFIKEGFESKLKQNAAIVRYNTHLTGVGCHRKGCCKDERDLVGVWYPPGAVKLPSRTMQHLIFPEKYVNRVIIIEGRAIIV